MRCWLGRAVLAAALTRADGEEQADFRVQGASSDVAVTNGQYGHAQTHEGFLCYQNLANSDIWLCVDPHGYWNVQPANERATANGYLISVQRHRSTPEGAGPWRKWVDGKWVVDPGVEVSALSAEPFKSKLSIPDGDIVTDEVTASVSDDRIRWTIAVMMFGALIILMVTLALANGTDPQIRASTYRLINTTFTTFIAVMATQGLWTLLFEEFLPAPSPRGLGLGYPITPGLQIVVSFAVFTMGYSALNFLAWKFQYSKLRLASLKSLGSHIVAFLGIFTFTIIQRQAVFQAALQFEGPLMTRAEAHLFTAVAVVLLVWFTFALYRQAALGARAERFYQPPSSPWPPAKPLQLAQAGLGSCTWRPTNTGGSDIRVDLPEWGEEVTEAEDEAAVIVVGFLLNQTIAYSLTDELPGLMGTYHNHGLGTNATTFWYCVLAVFALLSLVLFAIRAHWADLGRVAGIVQRVLAMSMCWCVYRLVSWKTKSFFLDNAPLAGVATAFVISGITCCLLVFVDKVLDVCLGRNASGFFRRFHGSMQSSNGLSLSEKATRTITGAFGILVGMAWEKAYKGAMVSLILNTDVLKDHVILSKGFGSLLLGFLLVRPWARSIVVRAEMTEQMHDENIAHELTQLEKMHI